MFNVQKNAMKQEMKDFKKGNDHSAIESIDIIIRGIEDQIKKLNEEIRIDETTYQAVATGKVEKKIKSGDAQRVAETHKNTIEVQEAKRIAEKAVKERRFNKIESSIEESIKCSQDKIKECERKIEKYQDEIKNFESEIRELDKKQTEDNSLIDQKYDATIAYFTRALEKCYDVVPVIVSYPPIHHKKIAQLQELIASKESQIRIKNLIINTELEAYKQQDIYESSVEGRAMKERKEKTRIESERLRKEIEDKAHNTAVELAIQKKEEIRQEVERTRQRNIEYREEQERLNKLRQPPPFDEFVKQIDEADETKDESDKEEPLYFEAERPLTREEVLKKIEEDKKADEADEVANKKPVKTVPWRIPNSELGPGVQTYPKPIIED